MAVLVVYPFPHCIGVSPTALGEDYESGHSRAQISSLLLTKASDRAERQLRD